MEDNLMFLERFERKIEEIDSSPIPTSVRRERKEKAVLIPTTETPITVYPLAEWKKMAVCNFLVKMRGDG
jgi:hypothetical protein